MFVKKNPLLIFIVLLLGMIMLAGCSQQQTHTNPNDIDFPSERITIVVPNAAGGGFDIVSRLLAEHWPKYLPNADFVIENIPGAGGSAAYTSVTHAEPDGHTIGIFNLPGILTDQVVGNVDRDAREIEWIGRLSDPQFLSGVENDSELQSLDDFRNVDVVRGANGNITSAGAIAMVIIANEIGFNTEVIPHEGASDALLSVVRGDNQWTQFPWGSMRDYVLDTKEIKPLWVYSDQRFSDLPDVPTIGELGYPELVEIGKVHRLIGATPGTPPEVLQLLRDSFWEVVNDPEFKEELLNIESLETTPLKHEDAGKLVDTSLNLLQEHTSLLESLFD